MEKSCQTCGFSYYDGDVMRCKVASTYYCNNNNFKDWKPVEDKGTTEDAKHYQIGNMQPIEVMQSVMNPEQFTGFLLGNVIKYSLRMNHKGKIREDAGKCSQYAEWLCQAMDGEVIVPGGKNE